MIVKLRQQDKQYSDLTFDQHYIVIGIEADALRILNDHGRPYLYIHANCSRFLTLVAAVA